MKKIVLISFAALLALVSCTKEQALPEEGVKGTVTFKASIVETKTHLGDKDGTSWPNYWSQGDVISVNGVESDPVDDSFVGTARAEFTVVGISAPYCAAYPASVVSDYANGSATITIPEEQVYVNGSYDPEAYVMLAKTSGDNLAFAPQMAIFSLTPTGTGAQIRSVSLTSLGGKKIAGAFTTDFESLTAASGAVSTVTLSSIDGIELGKPWMILIPASDFTEEGIKIVIEDADGGVMTRTTKPSKAYAAGKMYSATIPYSPDPLSLEAVTASSSSLVFGWGRGSAALDGASAYTVALYSDQACANLVVSFALPENAGVWQDSDGNEREPRFVIGGLDPSTTYYCKVTDDTKNEVSDPVPATTLAFTPVEASTVSNASAGDVLLAEDFSEVGWGPDEFAEAAGFIPSEKSLQVPSGALSTEDGSYAACKSTGNRLFGAGKVDLEEKRLSTGWGYCGNSSVYIRNGYFRVSTTGGRTHIVTPALSGIPAGKFATVDVTVTAAKHEVNTNDVAVFVENGLTLNAATEPTVEAYRKYTGESLSRGYALGLTSSREWETKTVRIANVTSEDQLVIGSLENISGLNRFSLSDVKVELVELSDAALMEATFIGGSSSSLAFEWTNGGTAAEDILIPYTITLYSDAACTTPVVSYTIEPGTDAETGDPVAHVCWNNKTPRFVFSGLDPGTTYYFKATNNSNSNTTLVVSGTTDAFTIVRPEDVSNAAVDDVILAEDFGEICWGGDLPLAAAGHNGKQGTDPITTSNADAFVPGAATTTELLLAQNVYNSGNVRLAGWAQGKNNLYMHPGYIKISTKSTNNAHIITPALTSLPADKLATLEVTITAAGWGSNYKAVAAVQHDNAEDIKNMSVSSGQTNTVAFDNFSQITLSGGTQKWATQTITVSGVQKGDRIAIGSTETIANNGEGRMMISDIVIKVTGLVSNEHGSVEISDFATLKAFLTQSASIPAPNGTVTANIALTAEEEAEIADLYPIPVYDATLEGGGFTISGLKKPFINALRGPVSNLTLESAVSVTEAQNEVGIFAMSANSAATLTNCVSKGSVSVAVTDGVTGDLLIGGMVGDANGTTFVKCQNLADVTNTTAASGNLSLGGLVGNASGATLSGTASDYNSNTGTVIEDSASENIAVGGICGSSTGSASDFSYVKNVSTKEYGDITLQNNTRNKIYVGGILGASEVTSSLDYASNAGKILFKDMKLSSTGQVFAGGIIGGWTQAGEQTITGCTNSGCVECDSSDYGDFEVADSENPTPLWSFFGGISGMGGSYTNEGLNGGYNTITGKTFTNCTNSGYIWLYTKMRCCVGGVVAYTENDPVGCVCTGNITSIKKKAADGGGIGTVGNNYHRQITGGVVGLCTATSVTNAKYNGTLSTYGSSPQSYDGGIIGYMYKHNSEGTSITLNNCKVGGSVRSTGSGGAALMCYSAKNNAVTYTFTNCVIKNGAIVYTTGKKVTISSTVTKNDCLGYESDSATVTNDVLPTIVDSID
ncbi:MAG: hypothetical protein IK045_05695 [Bacteroidales bacterium]|nr:hypothetical protein [Bacteroidales bacterium]